jgi:ribosomal protein S4
MKNTSKYKIYIKSGKIINLFPQRIKFFYRTKWKKFVIKNRHSTRRYKFFNYFFRTFSRKRKKFIRMKKYYKQSVLDKNCLLQNFDNSYKLLSLKKDLKRSNKLKYTDLLNLVLIKQNYYLTILLWRLFFFSSTNEATQFINNGYVLVNGIPVKSNYFLKSGDIISFKSNIISNFKKNLKTYKLVRTLCSFVEIDYYLGHMVIIKDFKNLVIDDFSFFLCNSINVVSISNNLR